MNNRVIVINNEAVMAAASEVESSYGDFDTAPDMIGCQCQGQMVPRSQCDRCPNSTEGECA